MFLRLLSVLLLALFLVKPFSALAQSEEERRKGFHEHIKDDKDFDREREAGLREYLKDQADWEEQRKKDREADKGRKKQESPREDGPEYKADRKEKYQDYEEMETERRAFVKEKKSFEAKNAKEQEKRNAWAMEELGLDQERPRFDIAKRKMYGDKSTSTAKAGSPGGFGGTPSYNPGAPSFPPAPTFDDDAYVPPPFPSAEPFEPPPENFPPPPPMPAPGEGAPDFEGGYFPPPAPPMPMPGGDEGF